MDTQTDMQGRDPWHGVVASNIRAEAGRRGVSQRALAEALGVSHTWVNARWMGGRPWALDDLERLGQVWGMDPLGLVAPEWWLCVARGPAGTGPAGR